MCLVFGGAKGLSVTLGPKFSAVVVNLLVQAKTDELRALAQAIDIVMSCEPEGKA